METIKLPQCTIYYLPIEPQPGQTRRQAEESALQKLLTQAFGEGTARTHNIIGAPVIMRNGKAVEGAVSVSHNKNFAAILHAPNHSSAGLDIEIYREQLQRVATRFLSARELKEYDNSNIDLLRAWTLKEAVYKAAGMPGVDLRNDINIPVFNSAPQVLNKTFNIIYSAFIPGTDTFLSAVTEL